MPRNTNRIVRTLALGGALAAAGGATACSIRTAATSDLWQPVSSGIADAGDQGGDLAVAGKGLAPSCAVDPSTVTAMTQVDVPAGDFGMGCNPAVDTECKADENPAHKVTLSDFQIDVTEVTEAQYALCYQAGQCSPPYCPWSPCSDPNKPIACVYHQQAIDYCAFAGERLPTEAEWEKAARGTDGRKYPWGNDALTCALANFAGCGGVKDVGQLTAGASPYGALDMAGNVVEWVLDVYAADYYAASPSADPQGPPVDTVHGSPYGGRGGGWRSDEQWERASARDLYESMYVKDSMGFRCAK